MNTNRLKELAETYLDEYEEAMDDKFNDEFVEFITGTPTDKKLTYHDVQEFLYNFEMPDQNEWAMSKAESSCDDKADRLYQEYKDK